ncbi:MAG: type II toxin-antitoxin system VapC family toxin [Acidimicrobiales bacterium]
MIRLDTHVVVWLYVGDVERLSPRAIDALESNDLVVSPIVQLELSFLYEIGRLRVGGADIIGDLRERIGLHVSEVPTSALVNAATPLSWTRDPFDRLIVADATVAATDLLTKDETIRSNVSIARW